MIFKIGNFLNIYLIKEMATSCSLTSKETKSWTFTPLFIATFFSSQWHAPFLELFFYFKLHCSLIFGKSLCLLFWNSKGKLQAVRNTASSESRSLPLSSLGAHSPPLGDRQLRSSTPDSWSLLADRSGSELFKLSWVRIRAESSSPCEGLLDGNDFTFPL